MFDSLLQRWVTTLVFVLSIFSQRVCAQPAIPIGMWRSHLSYQQVRHILLTPSRVYAAASQGLFYLDKADNSLNILSKNDGLSDAGIAALAYQPSADAVLVAYERGTIDLLAGNRIFPFTLIAEAGGEVIHHMLVAGNVVYVSTSAGVRVLNIDAQRDAGISIRESYTRLGSSGDSLTVYRSAIANDSLFLATEDGIIAASLSAQVNRQDFRSWRRFGATQGLPAQPVRFMASLDNQVYAGLNGSGLYVYDSGRWQLTSVTTEGDFRALYAWDNQIATVVDDALLLYDGQQVLPQTDALITQPLAVAIGEQGTLWIGDRVHGLIRKQGNTATNFFPAGPGSDDVGAIKALNGKIIALPPPPAGNDGAFYTFAQGNWTNLRAPAPALQDVVYAEATQRYYFASLGGGILSWDGQETFDVLNSNSPGSTLPNDQTTALAVTGQDLWISSFGTATALHRLNLSDNTWQGFSFNKPEARFPVRMILAGEEQPWVLLNDDPTPAAPGKEIMVFDPEAGVPLFVRSSLPRGALPGEVLTGLVRDRNGQVWAGGSDGVAYFPDPFGIFSNISVVKPVFDRQFLLLGEYVTAVAVDGGNRKWVGTRNGLWLFDETGESLIHYFTAENSPLLSNLIRDIAIDASGEVFIATGRGVVSYRGAATEGSVQQQSARIFPNPVLAGFDGLVGIQGLVDGATVKITSIAGTLIRQLKAEGGGAAWDVRDYRGQRVSTGVYLVFIASADGTETFVGKVAVVE